MLTFKIAAVCFIAYMLIVCVIVDAFLDRKQYKKRIRELERENAALRGKLKAKEYNYHEQMQSR